MNNLKCNQIGNGGRVWVEEKIKICHWLKLAYTRKIVVAKNVTEMFFCAYSWHYSKNYKSKGSRICSSLVNRCNRDVNFCFRQCEVVFAAMGPFFRDMQSDAR